MFKLKTKYPTFLGVGLLSLILFLTVLIIRQQIFNFLRLPLTITSSFISDLRCVFTYKFTLNENLRLRKHLDTLKKETIMVNELRLENERLRKLLSFKEKSHFSTVAALVIARDANNWSSGIIIGKGRRQNIGYPDMVITDLGLVGRVVEAAQDTSKVMLVNDPNSSVAAIIQRSRDEGIVSGTLFGGLVMRYLEKDSDVRIGDAVLTSGLTANYSAAILIGTVESIEKDMHGLGVRCLVKPAVNLKKLEEVLVIVENYSPTQKQ